jgi:electron transport complex protein RnfC
MLQTIKIDWHDPAVPEPPETPFPAPERIFPGIEKIDPATFPDFLDEIGHVGMGGSGFRTAEKIRNAIGSHTLVINAVECEPGITIDQSVMLHESLWVAAGANACAKAIGAEQVIIAVKKTAPWIPQLKTLYPEYGIETLPDRYPSGAEKLILEKLTRKRPAPGIRPHQLGYIIQNVVSLRAVGRAIVDGIPVIERPLTLAVPSIGFYKNIIVPVGINISEVLDTYKLTYDPSIHLIADSGLMMGHEVIPDDTVEKTTLSLLILQRDSLWKNERPCIRCGICNAACPLGLHPFELTEKIRKGKTSSPAFKGHMTECFLCGLCSAVCPSDIPLVQRLKEGKKCL